MDANDRAAIADLFSRLAEAEQRLPQRDPEAEALIRSEVARHPAAPYYMAQVIVAQQQALETAGRRIEALEQRGGGLFDGLFGGGQRAETPRARRPDGPWENRGGSGFLSGAAQTAMGVAGGVLLANVIGGALFGDGATAAEPPPEAPEAPETDGGDFDFDVGF
jgi:uncharacterized protein